MSMLRDLLPFVGLRAAGATDRMVNQGRQRSALVCAFLAFVLLAAGQADEEWVSGGFEFTGDVGGRRLATGAPAAPQLPARYQALCSDCLSLAAPPRLGASITRRFNLGLHLMSVQGSYHWNNSGVDSTRTCNYPLLDFVNDFNVAVTTGVFVKPDGSNYPSIKWTIFTGAQGTLVFAAVCMGVAWLALLAAVYEAPVISTWKWTSLAVRGLSLTASFFALVGILVFGTSPLKSEFCSVFDPDADFINLPCYYGNGFKCACTSVFFSLVSTILLTLFVNPNFSSGSVYEFGAKGGSGGYADASAPLGAASFQGSFQGGGEGAAPAPASSSAGGYSGFGSGEL